MEIQIDEDKYCNEIKDIYNKLLYVHKCFVMLNDGKQVLRQWVRKETII